MVADLPQTILVNGWRAELQDYGSYLVYNNMPYNNLVGGAKTVEAATQMMEDGSGLTYARLPPVKRSELTIKEGERQQIDTFPFRKNDYYQNQSYYLGEQFLGNIQTKYKHGKTTVMTVVKGYGVTGGDLRWLLKENGYRLVID